MRCWVAAAVLAGCNFTPPSAVVDAGGDAMVTKVCDITAKTTPIALGAALGDQPPGTHGIVQPDLVCPPDQLPIGVGFDTTTSGRPEGGPGDERVVRAVTLQCGTIVLASDGQFTVAPTMMVAQGTNSCGTTWDPITVAPIVRCPPNTALVGFEGNGGVSSLFNTVSIQCAALTGTGMVGGAPLLLAVSDTGNYTNNHQIVTCGADEVIVSLGIRANCGIDALTPKCSQLDCR